MYANKTSTFKNDSNMKDMSLWNLSFTKKDLSDALWFDVTQ